MSEKQRLSASVDAELIAAAELYETHYCVRGDMENRIKEQQLYLFAAELPQPR